MFKSRWDSFFVRHFFTILLVVVFCLRASPADAEPSENTIKAAMLRKFVEFIDWPGANAPKTSLQVHVCFLGAAPPADMTSIFEKTSEKSTLKFSVKQISTPQNAGAACQIVFVTSAKEGAMADTIAKLGGQPVLVTSDIEGFADAGGMIGFEIIGGKVRYNVNKGAFSKAGLKIDAQLLEIANKVLD